jgi:hypothetical protein
LLSDAEGGSEWFGEDGRFIGHIIGHKVQIGGGQCQVISEGTITLMNAESSAMRAMLGTVLGTGGTLVTANIDAADHTTADPLFISRLFYSTDKFMA